MNSWKSKFQRIFNRSGGTEDSRPNIIVILLDQFRNDMRDVHGIFGELHRRGYLFSRVITHAPYTLASMHAIYTGLYGRDTGVDGYTRSGEYDSEGCRTIVEYLYDAGYHTRGYSFSSILFPHHSFEKLSIVPEDEEPDILQSHLKELEDAFSQEKPFFEFLHYGEIHHEVVREVIRKYDIDDSEYFDHVERNRERYRKYANDAAVYVEKMIEAIDRHDPEGKSLIVVMTDHGGGLGEKKGEKAYGVYAYDYSICVWAYFICPDIFPPGVESLVQVRTVDILPTVLDILNLAPSKKHKPLRGNSLLPIVRREDTENRLAFTETGGVEGPHPSPDTANVKSVRDGEWKLIYNTTTNQTELYNLGNDPEELHNIFAVNPEKAKELWVNLSEFL